MARLPTDQTELPIEREPEPDRNFAHGGRSFYFFDFDDNVAFLATTIFLFEKETGREISVATGDFAQWGRFIGLQGPYANYEVRYEDGGSFRRFRDASPEQVQDFLQEQQPFLVDLAHALGLPNVNWQGPSWSRFYYAAFNQRPLSIITARGHHPDNIKRGIELFVTGGHLSRPPNYLAVYPVTHKETRIALGDTEQNWAVAALKQAAIRASVQKAFEIYGQNPHHRFGMSDDDPHNLELIAAEMVRLKKDYPENSFFIIETHGSRYLKREIFTDHTTTQALDKDSQLSLFSS